ncbi:hypothetical protein AURDEDRAFT_177741 [Auricularia subglabra TFB-10046 SS5]|uniref:Uncharacterized protein n=1 Tax=Auricularia subglabra (strain TFB-10046 / SS5) TaxID=717982 RepID=J0WLI3_AURST|nr:hypothetical protein AURDEDRAFT_177741 [Auricularia subglabra TFB-10046 SS5]
MLTPSSISPSFHEPRALEELPTHVTIHYPCCGRRRPLSQLACDTVGGELEPDQRAQRAPPHCRLLATPWRPVHVWVNHGRFLDAFENADGVEFLVMAAASSSPPAAALHHPTFV